VVFSPAFFQAWQERKLNYIQKQQHKKTNNKTNNKTKTKNKQVNKIRKNKTTTLMTTTTTANVIWAFKKK